MHEYESDLHAAICCAELCRRSRPSCSASQRMAPGLRQCWPLAWGRFGRFWQIWHVNTRACQSAQRPMKPRRCWRAWQGHLNLSWTFEEFPGHRVQGCHDSPLHHHILGGVNALALAMAVRCPVWCYSDGGTFHHETTVRLQTAFQSPTLPHIFIGSQSGGDLKALRARHQQLRHCGAALLRGHPT